MPNVATRGGGGWGVGGYTSMDWRHGFCQIYLNNNGLSPECSLSPQPLTSHCDGSWHYYQPMCWTQSTGYSLSNQLNDKMIVSDLIQNLDMIIVIVNNFPIVCDYYL